MNERKALVFALLSVLFWSTVATAFKLALNELKPIMLLFIAAWTSIIAMIIYGIILGKKKAILSLQKNQLAKYAITGLLNPFLYYLVLFESYSRLRAQEAQILNYTWAIVIAIMSIIFLKQKFKWKYALGLILSFLGVVVIITKGNLNFATDSDPIGIILALISSIIWGVYWIINIKDKTDDIVKLIYSFLFGSVYITIYALIKNELTIPSYEAIFTSVYIGLFEMGLTFVFWLLALKYTSSVSKISSLIYISPFISLLIINFVLGEQIYLSSIFGLVLIVLGVIISRRK